MVYHCKYCNYSSKRRSDLFRHMNRKTPCFNIDDNNYHHISSVKDVPQNVNAAPQNVNAVPQNVNAAPQNVNAVPQNVNAVPQNVNAAPQNVNAAPQNVFQNKKQCLKCMRCFSRNDNLKRHELICDGMNPLQCRICLKIFKTRQGKYQHMQYVKCNPPITHTINHNNINITNNIVHNTTNNNHITNNNIIRVDFGKECLKLLCEDENYLSNMERHVTLGKYAIPRSMDEIYFNDKFPENQTLKKERRNDKMVSVQSDGKWETRMFDDIYKDVIKKIERYHSKYFKTLQEEHDEKNKNDQEFKKIMQPLRRFAHQMLWIGWNCQEIRRIGLDLNDPEDEDETRKKQKDMTNIMLDRIYEYNT